jgi:hypothetical protein
VKVKSLPTTRILRFTWEARPSAASWLIDKVAMGASAPAAGLLSFFWSFMAPILSEFGFEVSRYKNLAKIACQRNLLILMALKSFF